MRWVPKREYTLEFKQQAVHRAAAKGVYATARALGLAEQTLRNWAKAERAGGLASATGRCVTTEQMELSRLRAENARLRMRASRLQGQDEQALARGAAR
jgi:transposase